MQSLYSIYLQCNFHLIAFTDYRPNPWYSHCFSLDVVVINHCYAQTVVHEDVWNVWNNENELYKHLIGFIYLVVIWKRLNSQLHDRFCSWIHLENQKESKVYFKRTWLVIYCQWYLPLCSVVWMLLSDWSKLQHEGLPLLSNVYAGSLGFLICMTDRWHKQHCF